MTIDLRSDTVTKPSKEMKEAMFAAELGDDVFNDDPTVIKLQEKAADMFGKEAALFCPSGIMCNQVAIKAQVNVGQYVLCDVLSHIYYHEGKSPAFSSGIKHFLTEEPKGKLKHKAVSEILRRENESEKKISLVSLENTINKGGGCFYTAKEMEEVSEICKHNNVPLHLDGARIFNALVETGDSPAEVGKHFDSISFCLSKGLGTPAGSLLIANKEKIAEARTIRNQFGGGMRQAGFLAAAGTYALDHNVTRLKDDHERARKIGGVLSKCSFAEEVYPVDTNIVIFRLIQSIDSNEFLRKLTERNIKALSFGGQLIRMVTHMDFTDEMLDELLKVLKKLSD